MRNSAYVYPDHGRIWLTQRVLREQGAIQMPHAARLLIESVYGEDVVMPEGFARSEQEQVGKYYCDRAMAKKFVLNFRRLCRQYQRLPSGKAVDTSGGGVCFPVAGYLYCQCGEALCQRCSRMGNERCQSASKLVEKHRDEFSLLEGEAFRQWCIEQRKDPEMANVILVTDDESCGYSAMGRIDWQGWLRCLRQGSLNS